MNLDLINQKLNQLKQSQEKSETGGNKDLIFKPKKGQTVVRILPDTHRPDYPFSELHFYYDFGRTYLSPHTFGEPDPVLEFIQELKRPTQDKEKVKDNWRLAGKLQPKSRTYVPILIRGYIDPNTKELVNLQEHEGVKFWGFGKTIYQELLSVIADPDFGDITDLKTGRDVVVEYIPAEKDGAFPDIKVRVKPNQSPATSDPEVLEKIKQMPDIFKHFTKPSYEELRDALKAYMTPKSDQKEEKSNPKPQQPSEPDPLMDSSKFGDIAEDFDKQFDDLFNN